MIKSLAELLSSNINKDYHKETHKSTTSKPRGSKQKQLYEKGKEDYAFSVAEQCIEADNYTANNMRPSFKKVLGVILVLMDNVKNSQATSPRAYLQESDKIWLSLKISTIAERAGVCIRTVYLALNYFEELGWVKRYKCKNTNGRKNKYAPNFFQVHLKPASIKKTMMLITAFLQLLSFTKPVHTDTKLYSNIYINKTLNIVSSMTKADSFGYAKSFNIPFIKKGGGGEMSEATINHVLEELALTITPATTENQLRSQVNTILCKHLKRDEVDYRVVEQATKRAIAYISKKRGEQRLRKTQEYMASRPFGVMGNTSKTNKNDTPHDTRAAEIALYCFTKKIMPTPEIIDTYSKISDAAEREVFKKGLVNENL